MKTSKLTLVNEQDVHNFAESRRFLGDRALLLDEVARLYVMLHDVVTPNLGTDAGRLARSAVRDVRKPSRRRSRRAVQAPLGSNAGANRICRECGSKRRSRSREVSFGDDGKCIEKDLISSLIGKLAESLPRWTALPTVGRGTGREVVRAGR